MLAQQTYFGEEAPVEGKNMVPHWQQSTAITIHSGWHREAAVQPSDFFTVQNLGCVKQLL